MRFAADAGGAGTEARASALTLLGESHFNGGRYERARLAYTEALASFEGYVPARAALLKVTAAEGRLEAARRGYGALVEEEEACSSTPTSSAGSRRRWATCAPPAATTEVLDRVHDKELAAGQGADAGMVLFEAEHELARESVVLPVRSGGARRA